MKLSNLEVLTAIILNITKFLFEIIVIKLSYLISSSIITNG
jgi:hypothetical protein